ncbi:MAG TPA: ABC transporter permease [Gaiellaceae bacterium]|nr:ABC transporter permease [Gaiellaceae bacterium]
MTDLVRSELLKIRTTRGWYVYLGVLVLLVGLGAAGDLGTVEGVDRGDVGYQRDLVEAAGFAALLALILGITVVTTEFRHGTITPSLLGTPRRERVVVAKTIAATAVGFLFAVLALAVFAVVAVVWLSAVGAEIRLLEIEVLERAGQLLLAAPLWALAGVAVGALVQSQVAALVGTLIWIFIGEVTLIAVLGLVDLDGFADYLPFQALDAADGTNPDLLPYWTGVGVSLAWAAVLGIAGTERLKRRDIT